MYCLRFVSEMLIVKLPSLNDVNYLAKYGFIHDNKEKRKINLHPLNRFFLPMKVLF